MKKKENNDARIRCCTMSWNHLVVIDNHCKMIVIFERNSEDFIKLLAVLQL